MRRRHQAGALIGALAAAFLCAGPAGTGTAQAGRTQGAAPRSATTRATTPVRPRSAAEAAERLRGLYFARDFEGGTAQGRRLVTRFPDSDQVRAWYLINRVRPWHRNAELVREAEAMVAARPDSPWALFALAGVFNWSDVRYGEALGASKRSLEAMPDDPEALWLRAMTLAMQGKPGRSVRFARRGLAVSPEPANLLNAIGVAHYRRARGEFSLDEALMARSFSGFEEARRADPKSVNAHFLHGQYLVRMKRNAEAYPLLKQAIALAPLSIDVHEAFWQAVMGLTDRSGAKNTADIEADIRRLRAARGRSPETLLAISRQYDEMVLEAKRIEVQDRILAIAPESEQAEWVLIDRKRDLARKIHEDGATPDPRTKKAYAKLLRDFVRRPRHHHEGLLGEAYASLFRVVRDDPTVGPDELLDVARKMLKHETVNVSHTYSMAAIGLAERGAHLREAEEIARAAFPVIREHMEEHRDMYDGPEAWALFLDRYVARAHDALGWVLFHQGRLDEAERELLASHDLHTRSADNLLHLGRLHENKGDLDRAEAFYARGLKLEVLGVNPCFAAFEALYEKRHGGREGLQDYLDEVRDSSRDARLKRVLEARLPELAPVVPFDLKALDGSGLSSADLRGTIAVINFWGLWCGWCLEEMPDFQNLHEQYRDDPEVRILTIDNDPSPEKVRDWMRRKKFDFRVLIDDGYLQKTGVRGFPTTWFLDMGGRRVFEKVGYSRYLAEEFAWRVEAIRNPDGDAPAGGP